MIESLGVVLLRGARAQSTTGLRRRRPMPMRTRNQSRVPSLSQMGAARCARRARRRTSREWCRLDVQLVVDDDEMVRAHHHSAHELLTGPPEVFMKLWGFTEVNSWPR